MSHRVEFVWHDHECYKVKFDGETICTLYKNTIGYWTIKSEDPPDSKFENLFHSLGRTYYWRMLYEARASIRMALKSCNR